MIRYFKHKDINKTQWDSCIDKAPNGLIYAYSWYLDIVSPGWDALILGDYEAVMPLTWRKKWGIKYLFQPFFTQQLGVFGEENCEVLKFIEEIPKEYRFVNFQLNSTNKLETQFFKERNNYVLLVEDEYSKVYSKYNRNCKRKIKKANASKMVVEETNDLDSFVQFTKAFLEEELDVLSDADYDALKNLMIESKKREKLKLLQVKLENKVVAAGSFLTNHNRVIFHVCGSTKVGKQNQAMSLLVDHQIKKSIGKYTYFDFSGSDIKGVAYFNSMFGAQNIKYPIFCINKLPQPLKWLKKC